MKGHSCSLALILLTSIPHYARNPTELKSDLQALMPAGVAGIRLAYIKSTDGCILSAVAGSMARD